MKDIFRKYLAAFIVLAVFQAIIIVTVVIHALMPGRPGLVNFVNAWSVFRSVFTFVANWAELLSGIIVVLAVSLLYLSFRRRDRSPSTGRLHRWATDAVALLSEYRKQRLQTAQSTGNFDELNTLLSQLAENSRDVLEDARALPGELRNRVRDAVNLLNESVIKASQEDIAVFADVQFLQLKLTDIVLSTYPAK